MMTNRGELPLAAHRRVPVSLLLATFAAWAPPASAQVITIAPKLRTGDAFRLQITHTRRMPSAGAQDTTVQTFVDVQVVSASADGVSLEWRTGETTNENAGPRSNPAMHAARAALHGVSLRVALNGRGEFSGLANETDVTQQLRSIVDEMFRKEMATLSPDERAAAQALIAPVISPATMLAGLTRDIQTYFGLNGISLRVGESQEADVDIPNPFDGTVTPAKYRITAESGGDDAAVLRTSTTFDQSLFLSLLRSMAAKLGKPIPDDALADLPELEMSDEGRYVLDRTLGLMRQVVVTRRVSAGALQQLERWDVVLVQGPKR